MIEWIKKKGLTVMQLTLSEWIAGLIELGVTIAVLICFFRSMKGIQQNQQILIDEIETLRSELKNQNKN